MTQKEKVDDAITRCNMNRVDYEQWMIVMSSSIAESLAIIADKLEPNTGKWISDKNIYKCTACNDLCTVAGWADCIPEKQMYKTFKFCPHCGAKMIESDDDA